MSAIPDQDVKKDSYTASEMQHLVAREVMKHRMTDLEQNLARSADNVDTMFGKVNIALAEIKQGIAMSDAHLKECRDDLRKEVDRDFATKLELQILEGKVDKMWAKITVAVGVVVFLIQYLFTFIGVEG